MEENWEL